MAIQISGTKFVWQELLGNLGKWYFINGPFGKAFRGAPTTTNDFLDLTDGTASTDELKTTTVTTGWSFAPLRAKAIIGHMGIADETNADSGVFNYTLDGGGSSNLIPAFIDLKARVLQIEFSGTGAGLTPGAGYLNKFGFVHTTGGSYTAGDILLCIQYDASNYTFVLVNRYVGQHLTTGTAISGTLSLVADWLYAWNGSDWIRKCVPTADMMGIRVIKVPFTNTAGDFTSTTQIPTDDMVLKVEVVITTAFSGSGSCEVKCNSQTLMPTDGNVVFETGLYIDDKTKASGDEKSIITSGAVVTVTITGTSPQGAGYALVYFTELEV